jgi:DNA-binding MarR family transcriptional regulator
MEINMESKMPSTPSRRARHPADVRVALDAFRLIVQALRVGRAGQGYAGLGSAQLFALQQIAEHPDASINDVAALTCTHQSSVSVVIRRLVQQRLVAKVASTQDRRRQRLAVTAKGRRVLGRAPAAVQEHLIAAIAALPAADRRAFAKSLRAIARQIAPAGAARHPPMFFEDDARGERAARR